MAKYGVLLWLVCALDIAVTSAGFKLGWWDGEFNPILRWILHRWGLIALTSTKLFYSAGAIFILGIIYRSSKMAQCKIISYMRLTIVAYLVLFIGALLLQMI